MICVYDIGNTEFDKNGDVILTPISGKIKQVAGGNYDLTLVHPIDLDGKWGHLQPDAIIRAPVPEETITTAYSGLDVDAYIVTSNTAQLRQTAELPEPIYWPAWSTYVEYSVGSQVSQNMKNWVCTYWDSTSDARYTPPSSSSWWAERPVEHTAGGTLLANLKTNTEVYYISGPENGWYYVSTTYGLEGYILAQQVEYSRHLTPEETQPRHITTQLFRIRTVTVDTKSMQVTVNAQHVSYDLSGVLMSTVKVTRKSAAEALAWLESAYLIPYQGTIATDLTSTTETSFSCEMSGKNGMFALLDPDSGVVATFDAAFRRDNWDLFVMENPETDRGFRIRYGGNMLGVSWKVNGSNLITRVMPVAKAENGDELFLDNDGVQWVDSEFINVYPVIRMERLKVNGQVGKDDGTDSGTKWTLNALRAEMQKQAEARFSVDKVDQLQHEITIDFEMLGDTAEYSWLKNLQQVLLYDTVIVTYDRIDLSATVTVSELEYDVVNKKITALKLTNVNAYNVKNVSGFNVLNNTITRGKLTDDAGDGIVNEAVDEANAYTKSLSASAIAQSKTYTNTAIDSYDVSIRAFVAANYEPKHND